MNNHLIVPGKDAWTPRSPAELSQRLAGVSRPWCVVGGWDLDLWQGSKTREHHDLEFTVLREDLSIFRQKLNDMEFYTVNNGVLELLPVDHEPAAEISQILREHFGMTCGSGCRSGDGSRMCDRSKAIQMDGNG